MRTWWIAGWIACGVIPLFLACIEETPNEITVRDALIALVSVVVGPLALIIFLYYAIDDEGLDWGGKVLWQRRAESSQPTGRPEGTK